MAVIVDIDHDDGTLNEYTSTATDSGDLSVEVGAALAGTTEGLQCVIDDTNAIQGTITFSAPASGIIRGRFYVDPNSITANTYDALSICFIHSNMSPWEIGEVRFAKTAVGIDLILRGYDDDSSVIQITKLTIADAEQCVEFEITQAATDISADGTMELWVDEVSQGSETEIDNYDLFEAIDDVRFGASSVIGAWDGTFYCDELVINDDGSEIGPVAPSTLSVSKADGLTVGDSPTTQGTLGGENIASDNAAYQGTGVRVR